MVVFDPVEGTERCARLLLQLEDLALRVDVDLPARELARQADVLPASADGLAQLIIRDDQFHGERVFVDQHARHLRRLDGVAHEARRVLAVRDDVDLLAAELLHHGLDSRALHPHAGADGIHIGITTGDCDLGPAARLTGAGLDANDTLINLGHLHLEELDQQPGRSPREHNLRPPHVALYVQDVGLDPVTGAIGLPRHLLANGQDRLGAAEIDDDVLALEAAHNARDQLALAVDVLTVDVVTLRLSDTLGDNLLGGLGGDPAEAAPLTLELKNVTVALVLLTGLLGVLGQVEDLKQKLVAELRLKPVLFGLFEGDLVVRVDDLFGDPNDLEELYSTLFDVVLSLDFALDSEHLLRGLKDGLLQGLLQRIAIDPLILGDLIDDVIEIEFHSLSCLRIGHSGPLHGSRHFFLPTSSSNSSLARLMYARGTW